MIESDIVLIERWLYGRPRKTQKIYLGIVERFLDWVGQPLQEIDLLDLQDYQAYLFHHRRLKAKTVNGNFDVIRSLIAFALRRGYISTNPATDLQRPDSEQTVHKRILTRDQVRALLQAAGAGRDRALLTLMYGVGCRVAEACGLQWQDFSVKHDGSVVVRILGKGNKERFVKVPESVWPVVRAIRGNSADTDLVFGIGTDRARDIVKAAVSKAELPEAVSPHWLRHSLASHAIEAGAPLPVVRDTLGHSNISVTDIYAHSNPSESAGDYLGL